MSSVGLRVGICLETYQSLTALSFRAFPSTAIELRDKLYTNFIRVNDMKDPKLDFVLYGGCPSLDLFNTLRRRKDPSSPTTDLLRQDDGLKKWLLKAQKKATWASLMPPLSPSIKSQSVSSEVQDQAIQLRDIIGRLIDNSFSSYDIERLNELARLRPYWELSIQGGELNTKNTLELEALLGLVAEDCIQLFTSDLSQNIKECAQERCGIVFLDRSNGAKRNWCSMKTCGNRAKASRFSEKKGTEEG